MPYETFEHTADVGLRIRAKDLTGLFMDAAEGFLGLITDPVAIHEASHNSLHEIEMDLSGKDAAELLMRWLRELLFIFSARKSLLVEYSSWVVTPTRLQLKAKTIPFDPRKHVSRHEVKAVTYHQFRAVQTPDGWEAEVIFDV